MSHTGHLTALGSRTARARRATLDLARPAALVFGVMFTVLGAVTVVRAGLPTSLTSPHVVVGWFHHTPLWGIVEFVLGSGLLAAAADPVPDRRGLSGVGVLALVFGLIVLVEPDAFHASLGIHDNTGWLFAATGAALLAAGVAPPLRVRHRP